MVGVLTLLILAVTCANLGGLQLARGVAREREMGIRLSLGASTARVFRQLVTESLVLALMGSAAGMLLAWGTLKIVLAETASPVWLSATPDWRVLAFVVAMALMATLLFGFAPALFPEISLLRSGFRKDMEQVELAASAVTLIGLVAVALAGVGILGLVSFSVSQRRKEIAIRLALGATKVQVLAALLRQFVWPAALGMAAGAGIAAAASRVLRIVLFGVSNLDPASYAAAILVLVAIVGLSALLPARRALRLELANALHYD